MAAGLLLAAGLAGYARAGELQWFMGNTHVHTTLGDGDSPPETVVQWYHDHGYNFLVLSEHNFFIDPATVKLPENKRPDFILVPGEELTGKYRKIHAGALNGGRLIRWDHETQVNSEFIQHLIDDAYDGMTVPILNHPNWRGGVSTADMLPVKGLRLMEIFNGIPDTFSFGEGGRIPMEQKWDTLLTEGREVFGVASDDAHTFKTFKREAYNPGRGWIFVRAGELSPSALTEAIYRGDFYASCGVALSEIVVDKGLIKIAIDEARTRKLAGAGLGYGRRPAEGPEGFRLELIGEKGVLLEKRPGLRAEFKIPADQAYVRCRAVLTKKTDDGFEELYAWGQPCFRADRQAANLKVQNEVELTRRQPVFDRVIRLEEGRSDYRLEMKVTNPFDSVLNGSYEWNGLDRAWKVSPASGKLALGPSGSASVDFKVTYAGSESSAAILPELTVRWNLPGGGELSRKLLLPLDLQDYALKMKRNTAAAFRAGSAPVIDGRISETIWNRPPDFKDFSYWLPFDIAIRPKDVTEGWAAYDQSALYLAFRCYDSDLAGLKTGNASSSGNDALEFLIDGDGDGRTYAWLFADAAGNKAANLRETGRKTGELPQPWNVAAGREEKAWTLEAAIPWEALGIKAPAAGGSLKLEVARNLPRRFRSWGVVQWAPTFLNNHSPARFGTLKFQ